MVILSMAHADGTISNDLESVKKTSTKKSLRLSKKKELILNKKSEERQRKEKEEQQKNENEKKDKDEDHNAMELEEFDTESKGKQKRQWAKADKDLFFEAVSEFGKDFDKICSFMDKKAKAKGKSGIDCEPRNKDQIRFFYYRTLKQISKVVSLQPSESKRIHHEVYCMICYDELRKKCRDFGKKDLKRLDELVRTGSTTVRYKGRKIRIKPPNCRFLKKLSDDEDKSNKEQEAIPEKIDVELYPRTNREWIMAQKLAFNPRIRLSGLPISLKVQSLMKLLLRRFNKSLDESATNETVVRLYPQKDVFILENSSNTPCKVNGTQTCVQETIGSIVAKPCDTTIQQNRLQPESEDCCLKDSSGNKVVTELNCTQTSLSQDSGNLPRSGPVVQRIPLKKVNKSPSLDTGFIPLENAIPTAVSLPTGSPTTVLPGIGPLLAVTSKPIDIGNSASLLDDSLVSIDAAISVIETGGSTAQSALIGNRPESQSSILGGNVVPALQLGSTAKQNANMSSLTESVAVLANKTISATSQNSLFGENVAGLTPQSASLALTGSIASTTINCASTSPKNQDKVLDGRIMSTVSDAAITVAIPQISLGESINSPVLSSSTNAAGCNAGKVEATPSAFSDIHAPATESTIVQSKDNLNSTGEGPNSSKEQELQFFPVTQENCIDKDLQACYVALNRPNVIRLEYELDVNENKYKRPSNTSFNKLVLLAQRDLCKTLKVTTQQIKAPATSRFSQMSRSVDVVKENQTVKPIYIAATFAEPQRLPLSRQNFQEGLSVGTKPVLISASGLKSSIGLVPSLKNVKQSKVVPRLRPIQPASKTLVAKAVAVNIVPQPAQLAQFVQVPAVSTQLINSGSSSLSTVNLTVAETAPTQPSVAVTASTFSVPSTSSMSSQLTIWGSSTTEPSMSPGVQVEVIQEGGRSKARAKRLRPTTIISTEKPVKAQRLETLSKEPSDISEFDLSFLGPDDDIKSKDGDASSEAINLSSILSGLTRNLCQGSTNEKDLPPTSSAEMLDKTLATSIGSTNVTPPRNSPAHEATHDKGSSTSSETSRTCSSVLTTPVKCTAKTPSKSDNSLDCYRIQPVNFDSQWFGGEMAEISIGGILDVGSLKDVAKGSDSSQAGEISIGSLLNVPGEKKGQEASLSPSQVSDVSLGPLLDTKDDNNKDKHQSTELSIGKFLGALQGDDSAKNQIPMVEPPKPCNPDSLLMKPDTDPVAVFESLMNENSIDYIRKFKDLTATVKAEEASNKGRLFSTEDNAPDEGQCLKSKVISNNSTSFDTKDPRLPIYTSEDSVGPLDDLSFVLPTTDTNSNDFA